MRKKIFIGLFIILLIAAVYYVFFYDSTDAAKSYNFVEVTRGNIITTISSTGTLQAVTTVDVGTQVSGIISNLYADYNDRVKKGKLLAVLDTTFLAASLRDAEAALARSKAQLYEAESKHELNEKLYEKNMISELDYIVSKTSVVTAKASVQSAQSNLERAITNLQYAFIYSPIDGIVISRNVEEGQTVAASLQAPTLFLIAEDLSNMEILAEVDESDIGQIQHGQKAKFTVQAYSDREFVGTVKQIRLQPQVVSNVVNYTVVLSADNEKGLLLPGMTATIDFYIEEKEDVLLIPNAALRFKPSDEMLAKFQEKMQKRIEQLPDSVKSQRRGMGDGAGFMTGQGSRRNTGNRNFTQLWYIDDKGELEAAFVLTGLTDGKNTEIVRGRNIKEGMKIIQSINVAKETNQVPALPQGRFGRPL